MRLGEASLLVFTLGMAMAVSAQQPPSVTASIAEVEAEFANALLDASPSDLRELGLTVGSKFTFTLPLSLSHRANIP